MDYCFFTWNLMSKALKNISQLTSNLVSIKRHNLHPQKHFGFTIIFKLLKCPETESVWFTESYTWGRDLAINFAVEADVPMGTFLPKVSNHWRKADLRGGKGFCGTYFVMSLSSRKHLSWWNGFGAYQQRVAHWSANTKSKHHRKPPSMHLGSKRRRSRLVKMWPEIP